MGRKQPKIYYAATSYIRGDKRVGIDYSKGIPSTLELTVVDGIILNSQSKPYTGDAQFSIRDNYGIKLAKVYPADILYMPHPTLTKGGPVIGAGKLKVSNGLVEEVNAESGHYRDIFNSVEYSRNTLKVFWEAFRVNRMKMSTGARTSMEYILFRNQKANLQVR